MATRGEFRWPRAETFRGRLWGECHGRRHRTAHAFRPATTSAPADGLAVGRAVARRLRAALRASHLSNRPETACCTPRRSPARTPPDNGGLARPVAGRRDKLSSEGLRRLLRVVALLGLADLGQHALGEGLDRPRQGFGGV